MENEVEYIYPANSLQQGFIFHALNQPEDDAYRVQVLFDYQTVLDVESYIEAWKCCIAKYPILRTAFNWEDDIIQVVYKYGEFNHKIHDISHLKSQAERDAAIRVIQQNDRNVGFDFTQPSLFRVHIIKQSNDFYTILKTEHHAISDGWSFPVLLASLHTYYFDIVANKTPKIKIDTAYLETQEYIFENKQTALDYWSSKLSGNIIANDISSLLSHPIDANSYKYLENPAVNELIVSGELFLKLKAFLKKEGITTNVLVQFIWHKLIQIYSNSAKTIVGTTISGRDLPIDNIGESVGLYINTLPLIVDWNINDTVQNKLHEIQKRITEMNTYSFADLVKLQKGGERLFHSLLVFFNYPAVDEESDNLNISFRNNIEKGDYILSFTGYETPEELILKLNYDASFLSVEKAQEHLDSLINILGQVIDNPEGSHDKISLIDKATFNKVIYEWNNNVLEYLKDKTVLALFSEQVAKTPDNIAVYFNDSLLSYKNLEHQSEKLAVYLKSTFDIKANDIVGIMLDRSEKVIIAMLGVMKAGAAYTFIEPDYPVSRKKFIADDAQFKALITQSDYIFDVDFYSGNLFAIDLQLESVEIPSDYKLEEISPDTLAYVIYTSGTTGQPKGVLIEHKNLINLVLNQINGFGITGDLNVLQFAPFNFDASVSEVFCAISCGAKLSIAPASIRQDASLLANYLEEKEIDLVTLPPAILSVFPDKKLESLKTLIVAGESCPQDVLIKWSCGRKLINAYGPTEVTVCATMHDYKSGDLNTNIGKPLANTKVYILNSNHTPIPVGVIGELYVAGAGVAKGYLNRQKLTNERFILNPFVTAEDVLNGFTRMYKTGDLARWLPDGSLEFIGRNDEQVKIRGFRVELGEIEELLSKIDGIKQACVVAKERKTEGGISKHIVGYYVLDDSSNVLEQPIIVEKLSAMLPDYMMPSNLVAMDELPLTTNGKIDKRILPDPEISLIQKDFIKPQTEFEIELCNIYASVLGVDFEKIGIHQNFFNIGGNSILAIQLKYKLNQFKEFVDIGVADLFKYNTISKLIDSTKQEESISYNLNSNINKNGYSSEIAVIGMSGAFSGVESVDEFWDMIKNQKESCNLYSKEECENLGLENDVVNDPNFIPVGRSVKNIDLFDPAFWDISPNEAKQLDPQIRKFIEHSWLTLEASGYSNKRRTCNIGVFAGSTDNGYYENHILNGEDADEVNLWEASASNSKDALATKTAFFLGLTGPANSINTACSTGLVSIVEACKNLKVGACNMALAGGVSLTLPHQIGYIYQEGMTLSKDGHCRTFDKESSGTIVGAGVAVVLLKRLEDAVKDGDKILSVIKGFASNNDGDRKTGYAAPSVIGQSECIISAQQMAGVSSNYIEYVECHGTATHLGDPIEVKALREAFVFNKDSHKPVNQKTILGAVKANIGHADAAAGVASFIKVCSMLQNNIIPAQVNFAEPNPELQLEESNFEVLKENKLWLPRKGTQRLAGVSSFGIGGTNAHVIIGDYLTVENEKLVDGVEQIQTNENLIVTLSAKSRQSLENYKNVLLNYLISNELSPNEFKSLVYTLQEKREHFGFRSAICASNKLELIEKLKSESLLIKLSEGLNNKVAFMFPGQGSQYINMTKELYDNEVVFRETVDQCIKIANKYLSVDLYELIFPKKSGNEHSINDTEWSQISLFIIEYSLAIYLNDLGVSADVFIGHSIGEYVAATLAGVFNLEDAIYVVIQRGQLMQSMNTGSMLAINTTETQVHSLIKKFDCEVAVINSPNDIVVSGTHKAIDDLKINLDDKDVANVILKTSHAYHSMMMDEAAEKFIFVLEKIKLNKPVKDFVSNLTGKIANSDVVTPNYWSKQLRSPVQFCEGVKTICNQFNNQVVFLEVGVGKGLSSFVNEYKTISNNRVTHAVQLFPSLKEVNDIAVSVHSGKDLLAKLWMNDVIYKPNEFGLFNDSKVLVDLPGYQFDFQKCWIEHRKSIKAATDLELLPNDQWLSSPVWASVQNLRIGDFNDLQTKSALIFIREDQKDFLEFGKLFSEIQFVVLGNYELSIDDQNNSKYLRVNSESEEDFRKLSSYLKSKKLAFDSILHCCSVNNGSVVNDGLGNGFYSLFLVRQFLLNNIEFNSLHVLTNGLAQITNSDPINAYNGALVGTVRNINNEFPDLDARIIDIGFDYNEIGSILLKTIQSPAYYKSTNLLAIRFGKLWEERFEVVPEAPKYEKVIKDGDVILITGGLGGIALSIAKHISQKNKVKFILVSRRDISKEKNLSNYHNSKLKLIEEISANNSLVDIQSCDVSDSDQVKGLVEYIQAKYKNIDGIIHTAGVAPLAIEDYNLTNVKNVLAGKVFGINNVLNFIDLHSLKYLTFTSSLSSIMGDVNRLEYCASNSYLDYLAVDYNRFKHIKTLSVNWPGWNDVGMVMDENYSENNDINYLSNNLIKDLQLNTIGQYEGAEMFLGLLNQHTYDQIVVSKISIDVLKQKLFGKIEKTDTEDLLKIIEADFSETEYQIAKIVADVLGISQISLNDDFFRIGGNSILAIHVANKISKQIGFDMKVTDLFQLKTCRNLANNLMVLEVSSENERMEF